MEYQKIKGVKHYVFVNVKEFNEYFNNKKTVINKWQQANEGDWVVANDGGVIQILKKGRIKHPQDRKNYKYVKHYVRTVVGTFLCLDKVYMDTDFLQHKNRYTFSKTLKFTSDNLKSRKNPTKKEKIFATNVAVGMGAVKSYMDAFSETDSYKAEKKAALDQDL